jgi:hypothetical protein
MSTPGPSFQACLAGLLDVGAGFGLGNPEVRWIGARCHHKPFMNPDLAEPSDSCSVAVKSTSPRKSSKRDTMAGCCMLFARTEAADVKKE